MIVYVLFMTIFYMVPGDPDMHVRQQGVKEYPTAQECKTELKRILHDMVKAYPKDKDFQLSCELREKPQPAIVLPEELH